MIVAPMPVVKAMMSGEMEFGRTYFRIWRVLEQLMEAAASIYSCSRTVRMEARSRRLIIGMPPTPMAMTVLTKPVPSAVQMMMASKIAGIASKMSSRRITVRSTLPPKKPATAPSSTPKNSVKTCAKSPMASE